MNTENRLRVKNFTLKTPLPCPLCPPKEFQYHYKKFFGLLRHIIDKHLVDSKIKGIYLRKWQNPHFVTLLPVQGIKHVEALVESYCKGEFDPTILQKPDLLTKS